MNFSFAEISVQTILEAMLLTVGSRPYSFENCTVAQLADHLIDEVCFQEGLLCCLDYNGCSPHTCLGGGRISPHYAALDMACACEVMLIDSADVGRTRKKYFGIYSRVLRPKYQEALLTGSCIARFALQNWKENAAYFLDMMLQTLKILESTTLLVLAARIASSTLDIAAPRDKRDGVQILGSLRGGMNTKPSQSDNNMAMKLDIDCGANILLGALTCSSRSSVRDKLLT